MIRIFPKVGKIAAILAEILVFAAFTSAQEWTPDHNPLPTATMDSDDQNEDSPLVVTGDFNHDGIADIAKITSHEPDLLTVLLGQTNGSFKEMTSKLVPGHTSRAMVADDFNKDGIPDLIVGDEDGTLTLFLGDGTGNFGPASEITRLDSVASIAVADFNKDGIPDIAISDWRASSVTVLLGVGNGSFGHMWSFPLRMRGTKPHIAAADFNGDGIPDLAVVYDEDGGDTFDVMLGNGNGTFTLSPDRSFSKNPNSHCNT
jgi:WD40 repeat protein